MNSSYVNYISSVVIDLLERNIDRRLFEIGFLYAHNFDKNGNPMSKY